MDKGAGRGHAVRRVVIGLFAVVDSAQRMVPGREVQPGVRAISPSLKSANRRALPWAKEFHERQKAKGKGRHAAVRSLAFTFHVDGRRGRRTTA